MVTPPGQCLEGDSQDHTGKELSVRLGRKANRGGTMVCVTEGGEPPPPKISTKCGGHIHPLGKQGDKGLPHRPSASLPPKGKGHS